MMKKVVILAVAALAAGLLCSCRNGRLITYELSATIAYENKSGSDIKVLSVGHPFPDDTLEVFSLKADSAVSFFEERPPVFEWVPVAMPSGKIFGYKLDHALIVFDGRDTVVHRLDFGDIENTDDDVFVPSDHNICDISSYELSYTGRYGYVSIQTYTFTEVDRYNHQ